MILIKVVIVTPFYYPIFGGITTFVDNLRKNLSKRNCHVFIISNTGKPDKDVKILRHGKLLFTLKSYRSISKKKPDIIHSHSSWNILAPCAIYKIFHPKTRLIHTIHTDTLYSVSGFKKKILEFLYSKCDVITFVSQDLKQKIESKYEFKAQKIVIYSGVEMKPVKESEMELFRKKYNLKDGGPIFSFIGPLVWKMKVEGVKILIESFKIVKKELPTAKLLIVGDGAYRKELELLVEKNQITNDIIFTGSIDNTFIPLSITDIYTHISLQEGLPIVLLEAMSKSKPIIASKTGGIPEVIEHGNNGLLVESNPTEISQTIISLFDNQKMMRKLGENAENIIKRRYKWEMTAEKFLDLYKSKG